MIKNFFKTAIYFLRKNGLFTAINTLGLSIALAVSFLIVLFVVNELKFNSCHENKKRIYRVVNYYTEFKNTLAGTPYVLASTMKEDFPQVEKATQTRYVGGLKLKLNDNYLDIWNTVGTSSDIFEIFSLPLTHYQPNTHLLDDLNSIVLSHELAEKIFPDGENPVGKDIEGLINNEQAIFKITGVFENIPKGSTIQASCFVNGKWTLAPIDKSFRSDNAETNWNYDFWTTWILLADAGHAKELNQQFREFEIKHISEKPEKNYSLQNLKDVYLKSENILNTGTSGNLKNIKLFSLIAFIIVLIAAMNYILLSTAVSTIRTKEIGIRKATGASNKSVRFQLFIESVMLSLVSLPIALGLALLAKPYAGELFQTKLHIINSNIGIYILVFLIVTIFIGLASGGYTAGYLSRLKVINILKNNTRQGKRRPVFQTLLIIAELVIFCTFVTSAMVIRSQYKYFMTHDPGYNTENVLLIELGRSFNSYIPYLNSIKSNPNVIMAAGVMEGLPMRGSMSMMVPHFQEKDSKIKVEGLAVDYNFLKTMGIAFVEGRDFSEDFGSDLKSSVIINETAIKHLGIENPIGKQFAGMNIIGVVKDFNLHSLQSDIPPLYISMTDKYIQQIAVHYTPGSLNELLPLLQSEWQKFGNDLPFRYSTIEDINKEIYTAERNLTTIVSISALFTLIISMFGLFGLTLFVTKSRTKEIGIKKVLGSSEQSIVYSFLRGNLISVLSATIVSVPVTYLFMSKWLNNFAYKTNINMSYFILTLGFAILIVTITVSIHSLKASQTNPVEALRYE
ncbi:MAG: ABC transporter permease [Prolixibacteraceae bacterium]|nr:ABC transporter permease [Prolixibacteraceae bacterium]